MGTGVRLIRSQLAVFAPLAAALVIPLAPHLPHLQLVTSASASAVPAAAYVTPPLLAPPQEASGIALDHRARSQGAALAAASARAAYLHHLAVLAAQARAHAIALQRAKAARAAEAAQAAAPGNLAAPGPAVTPSASPPASAAVYSYSGLEQLWVAAGGPPAVEAQAAAIAECESGGRAGAYNPSGASGIWQILGVPFPGDPFDPFTNARMAVAKYHGAGDSFAPWVCQA